MTCLFIQVHDFVNMTSEQRTELKVKLLLERFKVIVRSQVSEYNFDALTDNRIAGISKILYKMNIWQQFNLANQSFMSDWQILYWWMLLYFTCIRQ